MNATIFAYGATGSGKTFTLRQLISHASADVFDTITNLPLSEYSLQASAMEIYNERVRDLSKEGTESQDLDLLELRNKHTTATIAKNLTLQTVTSQQQLERFIATVCARRTVRTMHCCWLSSHSWIRQGLHQRKLLQHIYVCQSPGCCYCAPRCSNQAYVSVEVCMQVSNCCALLFLEL